MATQQDYSAINKAPLAVVGALKGKTGVMTINISALNIVHLNILNPILTDSNTIHNLQSICVYCLEWNPSPNHETEYPEHCLEHRKCIRDGEWKAHLEETEHTRCPLEGCPKAEADFRSGDRFLQHWGNKHPDKCYYRYTATGFWGGISVEWGQWYLQDQ